MNLKGLITFTVVKPFCCVFCSESRFQAANLLITNCRLKAGL